MALANEFQHLGDVADQRRRIGLVRAMDFWYTGGSAPRSTHRNKQHQVNSWKQG
jgi:hypothetical protein